MFLVRLARDVRAKVCAMSGCLGLALASPAPPAAPGLAPVHMSGLVLMMGNAVLFGTLPNISNVTAASAGNSCLNSRRAPLRGSSDEFEHVHRRPCGAGTVRRMTSTHREEYPVESTLSTRMTRENGCCLLGWDVL